MIRPPSAALPALLAVALAAVACAPASSPSVEPASPSPGPTGSSSTPVATEPAPSTHGPTPTGLVAVDRSLLDVLPQSVAGLTIEPSPDAEAGIAADPQVAALFERFASAIAIDLETGDFVFATVLAPHPATLTDEIFRDYRDSFDEGACSQAGGVVGNAEAEIGGRTVYIGSCAGGLRTYHARLADRDLVVSASSVGEARLGELVMDDLR